MNRDEMLSALLFDGSEICREIAKRILSKPKSYQQHQIGEELNYTGRFMTAVLKDDFETAIRHADQQNTIAFIKHCVIQKGMVDYRSFELIKIRMENLGINAIQLFSKN